ncbi:hypothetical protein V5O48_007537 [Marasmius crinis-equi]|uniref:Uncharacterized protein n=1 Tax=Marasmius crinis-equi TaxID=585013 RepID=A0ABR3FGE5_9AGAR
MAHIELPPGPLSTLFKVLHWLKDVEIRDYRPIRETSADPDKLSVALPHLRQLTIISGNVWRSIHRQFLESIVASQSLQTLELDTNGFVRAVTQMRARAPSNNGFLGALTRLGVFEDALPLSFGESEWRALWWTLEHLRSLAVLEFRAFSQDFGVEFNREGEHCMLDFEGSLDPVLLAGLLTTADRNGWLFSCISLVRTTRALRAYSLLWQGKSCVSDLRALRIGGLSGGFDMRRTVLGDWFPKLESLHLSWRDDEDGNLVRQFV